MGPLTGRLTPPARTAPGPWCATLAEPEDARVPVGALGHDVIALQWVAGAPRVTSVLLMLRRCTSPPGAGAKT